MKFRTNKVKHEHSTTNDMKSLFATVSQSSFATSVLPGQIKRKHGTENGLFYQYTQGGTVKLLAKGTGIVQEVCVVTSDPEKLLADLRERVLLRER